MGLDGRGEWTGGGVVVWVEAWFWRVEGRERGGKGRVRVIEMMLCFRVRRFRGE